MVKLMIELHHDDYVNGPKVETGKLDLKILFSQIKLNYRPPTLSATLPEPVGRIRFGPAGNNSIIGPFPRCQFWQLRHSYNDSQHRFPVCDPRFW